MKRKKIKTILCHMAIITICMGVFCHGYIVGNSISLDDRVNVYAEDNWTSINQEDLVDAFRAYCKSRNITIDGSVLGSATSWTSNTFYNICSTLGINVNQLQAEIQKSVGDNLGAKYLFSVTGITAYNRICAELLQNYDVSVGDTDVNKIVESGEYFTDQDGFGCMIFVCNRTGNSILFSDANLKKGSYYRLSGPLMNAAYGLASNSVSFTAHLSEATSVSIVGNYTYTAPTANNQYRITAYFTYNGTNGGNLYTYVNYPQGSTLNRLQTNGCICISRNINSNDLYLSRYAEIRANNEAGDFKKFDLRQLVKIENGTTQDTDIKVVSPVVKPALPEDEPIEIDPNDDPGGGGDPGGGDPGGGGGEPDNWNPTTPTIPSPSSPDFPSVELPDIDIPDLPSLNFSLGDLRNKFPFSLPFDIIAVLNVLDGEPQAPHIEATVPIGRWYTWEMDFDFSEFDNYARIFRAFEFIGFCIGLAVFTVHFVKG